MAPLQGWYPPEKVGDQLCRWMGNTHEAWIDLSWPSSRPREAVLECYFITVKDPGVEVLVNGHALPPLRPEMEWRADLGQFRFVRAVPASAFEKPLRKDVVRITFRVAHPVRPSDVFPGNKDTRRLGLALHELSLRPGTAAA
jgi:hypothetical protein